MEKFTRFFRAHKEAAVFMFLLLIAFVLLSLQSTALVKKSNNIGYSLVSSVQLGFSRIGFFFTDSLNSMGELKKLRAEYETLQTRIDEYQHIERDLLDLKRENEALKKLLGFSKEIDRPHLAARIIARNVDGIFESFVIDKGERDGVRKDMPLISYTDGFQGLVGRIVDTAPHTAKVLPLIDRSSYIAARVQKSRQEGLVRGAGDPERIFMEYVNKRAKEDVSYGDLIVSSGLSSIYPTGLYIGRVRSFKAPEWETSLTLEIEPIVDFSRIEYVFVLLSGEREGES
jgi:rod shape-determining protein MreC